MELERKKEIAAELIKKAVEISETTDHDVFVYYSPHVDLIDLNIHKNGWNGDSPSHASSITVSYDPFYDSESEFENAMAVLESLANK